jgi:hypothetical protein
MEDEKKMLNEAFMNLERNMINRENEIDSDIQEVFLFKFNNKFNNRQ